MFYLIISQIARLGGFVLFISFWLLVNDEGFHDISTTYQYVLIVMTLGSSVFMFCLEKVIYEVRLKQQI